MNGQGADYSTQAGTLEPTTCRFVLMPPTSELLPDAVCIRISITAESADDDNFGATLQSALFTEASRQLINRRRG